MKTISPDPAPVIWLDDEWGTQRESALAPWQRALQAEQSAGRLRLTQCNNIVEFARYLREGAGATQRRFKLLIIDVMLTEEVEKTYASLGFDEEQVKNLDSGAQIAELIRSSRFDAERPEWLARYTAVPMMLLSSSPYLRSLVSGKVGHTRMSQLKMVSKSPVARPGSEEVDADDEFVEMLRELLADDV